MSRKTRKRRVRKKPAPLRTSFSVTAFVGLLFAMTVITCIAGAYQLFRTAESHPPYLSVVLMPSRTPTATPYPPGWKQASDYSVPILMYHHIRPLPEHNQMARNLSVSPETFGRQLDYIKAHGYTPITFSQLREGVLPPKPVILTFDDGSDDAYTAAFPALKQRDMTGVFYVISGVVGHSDTVNWDQLREMQRTGMEIGAHTVSHPDLATASEKEQQHEIDDSIIDIQEHLGEPVISFAYPSGKSTPQTVELLKAAGITYSVTTNPGVATNIDNPQLLPRQRITDTTDFSGLLP
jgi:peptidoglycan/xylan/chitin deacetylase (PgdA/CDA1 family)